MIPLRPMRALLLLMVLISVGQASVMASANGDSTSTPVAAAAAATTSASKHDGGGATWTPSFASPSTTAAAVQQHHPSVVPGQHLPDGVILITEFASPASTFPSAETAATSNQTTRPNNPSTSVESDDISAIDEQLVLTEKVINFDAESTAPPLNELTGNGAVARDPNNGLFRIKIAEIITDEFDNGLMGADRMDAEAAAYDQQRRIAAYQNAGKIKLADLYPSKLEDFGPIIRQSNERLINDKHVFVQDDGDDEAAARRADDEELRGHVVLNSYEPEADADDIMRPGRGGSMSRMPTTKIEIELIDDVDEPVAAAPVEGKVSDFTRELLRDNDGVINTIERSFVNVSPQRGDGERVVAVGGSINKALDAGGFIERRVKKLDPMAMGKNTPVEHAATHEEKPEETEEHSNKEKPEFSTTKFYNSKEMSDLMHKKQEEVVLDDVKPTTVDPVVVVVTQAETEATPSAAPVLTTTQVADKAKTFNINTPKAANKLKKVAKKILAVSKPLKVKTTMKATVETPSTTALPSSSLAPNTVPPTQISEDATPLATAKERPPTTILTTAAATETSSGASEETMPTSSASPPVTDATSTSNSLTTTTTQTLRNAAMVRPPVHVALPSAAEPSTHRPVAVTAMHVPSALSRLQEKLNVLDCDMPGELAPDVNVWRGNETHELNLPNTIPENCSAGADCMPMVISWEGTTEIQSGDVLIVEIDDSLLVPDDNRTNKGEQNSHKVNTAVYQVTRPGHEHCDVTEGVLLDITPLEVDGKKLVTLYDKDLTEGVNLLIVVSELWGQQCVRLKVTVKSDNCGESADCSGKGVCYSNASMEGYECQCCTGFAGPHCEEIDACSPSPCTNNGICVDLSQGHEGNAYQCLCPYGYAGKNCQFETDPCNPSECQNGGSCSGNATHFRCDCAPGFSGPLCQHNQNECESSPCVHGICVDQEDGFRCFCQPGFAGELCNFEYNECESNPCLNGGQCADHIGGFACKCTRGYSGKRCHIKVDFCANNPCPEGHRCNDRGDDYTCECPGGRNGPDCNQVPRTLCNINPCANGGTCWTSEESFYCACRPGYTGKMCEDEFIVETVVSSNEMLSDDSALARPFGEASYSAVVAAKEHSGGLHNAYVAVGTFATAIVIVVAVVAGCHCKFNQTYRRFAAAASRSSNQLLPTFAFSRRSQKQSANHRHWLSGKGADRVLAGSNVNLSQSVPHHLLHKSATSAQPFNSTGAALQQLHQQQMQHNQLLQRQQHQQQQQQHHGPQSSAQQVPQQQHQSTCLAHPGQMQRPQFNRHLAMNLENDMYYTVDFSESQQSPLIQ